ncbi:DEKNAAC101161 [Brettanomyces naardenensis]|uniref:Glucan 1,3-beta-glucosidase n=1 Tax=Brettanomyces naardenensis TaxID=13370 RepID=A0A448YH99_BRENA|nr:DEKNAAC101161 [Brettanomyces naardenensis]
MKFLAVSAVVSALLSFVSAAPIVLKKRDWDYSSEKIHGVDIGGWLVLEPYITPSLFEAFGDNPPVDEYHYTQWLGKEEASNRLQNHWSTWITETDFSYIAGMGLNFVRIPIGYWAFDLLEGDPYVQGQQEYLDQALGWCAEYGLKAWIDLHGAPGSQNGFDNSGLRDQIGWQSGQGNVNVTLGVLSQIATKYSSSNYSDVVIGIELVNEPLGPELDMNQLTEFYNQGYEVVRGEGNVPVIIHDAFQADGYWDNVLNTQEDSSVYQVIVDHHHYQVFSTGELQRDLNTHIQTACNWGSAEGNEYHWNIVGEWSAALTDCAKWLNGAGRGARYDSSYLGGAYVGSCNGLYTYDQSYWTQDVISQYRQYVEAQMDAYENGKVGGWVFWCWKTESTVEWDFQRLAGLNIIPQPLSDRWFPNQCGF